MNLTMRYNGYCARCGNLCWDDELMDFGLFIGKLVCADCWDAECEAVYAKEGCNE